jgi:hypothetical protein
VALIESPDADRNSRSDGPWWSGRPSPGGGAAVPGIAARSRAAGLRPRRPRPGATRGASGVGVRGGEGPRPISQAAQRGQAWHSGGVWGGGRDPLLGAGHAGQGPGVWGRGGGASPGIACGEANTGRPLSPVTGGIFAASDRAGQSVAPPKTRRGPNQQSLGPASHLGRGKGGGVSRD